MRASHPSGVAGSVAEPSTIPVRVVCALVHESREIALDVPSRTGARDILRRAVQAGLRLDGTGIDAAIVPLGVHGRRVADDDALLADDRLELYRPLQQDPMTRRRREAARTSGAVDPGSSG